MAASAQRPAGRQHSDQRKLMFVGHYGASLAAKGASERLPLGWLFVAAQLPDIVWSALVPLGVERARLVDGVTGPGGVLQEFVPYSHGLVGTVAWAGLAYLFVRFAPLGLGTQRSPAAAVVAGVVASHYMLDVVVHPPELPVVDHSMEIGLNLGRNQVLAFAAEAGVLVGGLWLYLRGTTARTTIGRYGMAGLIGFMLAFNLMVMLRPPPSSLTTVALSSLGAYALFATIASEWIGRHRMPS